MNRKTPLLVSALAVLQVCCGGGGIGAETDWDNRSPGADPPADPGRGIFDTDTDQEGENPPDEPPDVSDEDEPVTPASGGFVSASDGSFILDGEPFYFGGANSYDLAFGSHEQVDATLDAAVAMDLKVMRAWFFYDSGSFDGQGPAHVHYEGNHQGVYFHFWDNQTQSASFNEGENGLAHLDYVLAAARDRGLKILVVLTNNWSDMGGMDQYLTWYDLPNHENFYTDERVQQDYQDWISHLVQRTNTVTEVVYRDDPTIFAWELANEPRCRGSGIKPTQTCDPQVLTAWADRMARFIKQLDPNHMVAVGNEGFFDREHDDWFYNGSEGTDQDALAALEVIDFITFHLYYSEPNTHWGREPDWFRQFVQDQIEVANQNDKPIVLEEIGMDGRRIDLYAELIELLEAGGGDGFNFWQLVVGQDDQSVHVAYPSPLADRYAELARNFGP